jgi:PleD family two-component response regulator
VSNYDWEMEPVDGYALLKTIRSDEALAATPFIMVTLHTDVEKVIAAKNAGVNAFISKPFTAKMLKEKILLAWKYQPRQGKPLSQAEDSLDLI